jgi:acyl-CoA dehydrogenase
MKQLAQAIRVFTEQRIMPCEAALSAGDEHAQELLMKLKHQARQQGLWGNHYPADWGGKGLSFVDYQTVAQEEGRSEWGPVVFGTQTTLDTHILRQFGSEALQARYQEGLVSGALVGAYGMSEPHSIGSVPSTIETQAHQEGQAWVIHGRKWFISRAKQAEFVVVVAKTPAHPSADSSEPSLSMILVPMSSKGLSFGDDVCLLGRDLGQAELIFDGVRVPHDHLIGLQGQAPILMQTRLKLGRTMNAAHWVGLAQRCFDVMCHRINSPRGQQARLPEKQLVRQHVFNVYQSIGAARAHLRCAGQSLDQGLPSLIETQMAKVAASQALSLAVDSAIQMFGAEGLSDANPLSRIYRMARTTRILDGADEVLINAVGRQILETY